MPIKMQILQPGVYKVHLPIIFERGSGSIYRKKKRCQYVSTRPCTGVAYTLEEHGQLIFGLSSQAFPIPDGHIMLQIIL